MVRMGSAYVAVIAAQRGLEPCVVPSTLWCRWNGLLPRVDGEGHGESRRCSKRVASHGSQAREPRRDEKVKIINGICLCFQVWKVNALKTKQ